MTEHPPLPSSRGAAPATRAAAPCTPPPSSVPKGVYRSKLWLYPSSRPCSSSSGCWSPATPSEVYWRWACTPSPHPHSALPPPNRTDRLRFSCCSSPNSRLPSLRRLCFAPPGPPQALFTACYPRPTAASSAPTAATPRWSCPGGTAAAGHCSAAAGGPHVQLGGLVVARGTRAKASATQPPGSAAAGWLPAALEASAEGPGWPLDRNVGR